MGINLETVTFLSHLQRNNYIPSGNKCLEFGAQDISADPAAMAAHLLRCGLQHDFSRIDSAPALYKLYGFDECISIDATAEHGSLAYDLNKNLREEYGFNRLFDLVTDFGTFEHVFDTASAFRNAHEVCRAGGLMVHALPSNCNANHGYYVLQPRLIADISAANDYEIVEFAFTVDYQPILYEYNIELYSTFDDRDLMFYVALRKLKDKPFMYPFDSIFTDKNTLSTYRSLSLAKSFVSYIKDSWENVRTKDLNGVPTTIVGDAGKRKLIKKMINYIGTKFN